ncbi:hypothetical protein SPWS13_3900 [Shewanella putrefaciens]|nr:hypothetical protein SPWS13_3900 [Shewanella putrefaciens]
MPIFFACLNTTPILRGRLAHYPNGLFCIFTLALWANLSPSLMTGDL